MSWLTAALSSSVGKKFVMGLTGLFLCLFLVIHLAGNLLLFVGPETYNDYAHKLHDNPELLAIAEILLYAAFLGHILMSVPLTIENWSRRSTRYAQKKTKVEGRVLNVFGYTPDNTMFISGLVVLLFLVVHLSDFRFEVVWGDEFAQSQPYDKARAILAYGSRIAIYTVGSIVLGVHVSHGLASAFQSLGLNHPKYTPCIKAASVAFGFIVAIGFGCIPLVVNMMTPVTGQ